jgi:hypothetical protein
MRHREAKTEGKVTIASIVLLLLVAWSTTVRAEGFERTTGDLLDVEPNAYGLGVNSDQYGRPHVYRTPDAAPLPGIFTDGVRRNAYGLGVHADEFGRPLRDGKP